MTQMQIAFASDENFIQHVGCVIASILVNAEAGDSFSFHILDGGITPESRDKIDQLQSIHDFEIQFHAMRPETFAGCLINERHSINTYFRLILPELLPDIEKIIYLDGDLIVLDSLREFWEVDLGDDYLAGSTDGSDVVPEFAEYKASLAGHSNYTYFSAGVLLMNLKQMRLDNFFERSVQWIRENPGLLVHSDQDALNALACGRVTIVPYCWNFQTSIYLWDSKHRKYLRHLPGLEQAIRSPRILHYAGNPDKPWRYMNRYPQRVCSEYWKYLEYTPWKDFVPPDKTSWNRLVSRPLIIARVVALRYLPEWVKVPYRQMRNLLAGGGETYA